MIQFVVMLGNTSQAHPTGIVTLTVPVPPAAVNVAPVGDSVTLLDPHDGAVCVSVKVC